MKNATRFSKRALSVLLAVMTLLSCFAVAAGAAAPIQLTEETCKLDKDKKTITVDAFEYESEKVVFTATPAADSTIIDGGKTMFYNLQTGTTYTIVGKVGEEAVTDPYPVKLLNSKPAPAEPIPEKLTATEITVKAVSGCEYRLTDKDGNEMYAWSNVRAFTGLTPSTRYTIYMRYAEVADTYYASPASFVTVTTLKEGKSKADVPVLVDKTDKTITVKAIEGVEFSRDQKTWNTTGEFTGLTPATPYEIYARYSFDPSVEAASPISDALKVTTNAKARYEASIDKVTFAVTTSGDLFANSELKFKVTGDQPKDLGALQYGDTRYVPVSFTTNQNATPAALTADAALAATGTTTPTEGGELLITVTFRQERWTDGHWVATGATQKKDYSVSIHAANSRGSVALAKFINFFTNTLPKSLVNIFSSDAFKRIVEAMTKMVKTLLATLSNR